MKNWRKTFTVSTWSDTAAVSLAECDENHGVITVDVEEKDYADNVKKQLKEIGKKHAEPGFRPGHVPAGLIAKKYGNAVKYDEPSLSVPSSLSSVITPLTRAVSSTSSPGP